MLRDYGFDVDEQALTALTHKGEWQEAYALLANPMHEWLYAEQRFEVLDNRTKAEQLILTFDYVQLQVGQGGFIQLIQNGYISLLVTVIEALQALKIAEGMVPVLDDVLKVFVLNKDILARETSVEEFGKLYSEFREFEDLETRFNEQKPVLIRQAVEYVTGGERLA